MSLALALVIATQARIITLAEAVKTAIANQPQIQQARANTEAAWARVGEARAALLPQLVGTAVYERTTANFIPRPGLLPAQVNMAMTKPPSLQTFNFFTFGLTLNQYLWDFRAPFAWSATRTNAQAQASLQRSTEQLAVLNVRTAYFNARAQKALAQVARDNLANQVQHREQIRGFVDEGVRPEIDRAQADTDYANAEVLLINATNAYDIARAQLNQAMGVEQSTDYDLADETFPPVEGENAPIATLFEEAKKARPDLASLEQQVRAQRAVVRATKGGYAPIFAASMALTDAGTSLNSLTWNWNVTVTASWPLFDGLFTYSLVKESSANMHSLAAQREALEQQVLFDVTQASLQLRAARQTLAASEKTVVSARLQLTLAEERYRQGAGNVIEQGDALIAHTQANAQRVQAEYNLAAARAQLLRALGRI